MNRGLGCVLVALLLGCGGQDEVSTRSGVPSDGGSSMMDAPSSDTTVATDELVIPEDAPTVVFLGDSIGAGLHLAEHQAFPAVLQRMLFRDDLPFHLINASESGRTSSGGVTAMPWVLRSKPDVVVIELGGNDGLRGIQLEDTEANLRAMIEMARAADATVLLLGVQIPQNYGDYAVQFGALYPNLAQELDLAFVPEFLREVGGVPEMNLEDGLHPTAEGHEHLALNVVSGLRSVVRAR